MSLSKDDIMSQFDEGVAEIERTKKRGTSNLGEMFETGVREIEKSREGLLKKAGRAVATLPPTFGAMGAGIVQYGAEAPLRGREGIVESLGLIQREGAALPKKEAVPVKPIKERVKGMSKSEIFMESLEEQYGKQVKPWGKAVEYIRGTDPVKWIMEHGAKGDVAKAMLDEDLPAEAAKLIREEKYAEAEKYLKDVKFTEHPELAQKYERDPLRKAIEVGGEKAILDPTIKGAAAFGKGARGLVEDIGPVSKRGTAAYYVAGAIQGVGPMALTVGAAIIAKKPYLALPMMFPQVLGQGYSEDRAKGKSALDAAKENTFKAFTEIASEAVPIGIAIKVGGKFTTKVFKTGAAEGLQETINEGINIAYEEGILDEHTPAHEIGKRLIDAQIIGSVGGMGMGAMTHPLSGKEVDSPDIVKKDILDSITEVYGKGEQTAEQTVESLTEGYRSEVFGDADLSEISKAHPELKSGIDAMTESVRTDKIKNGLIGAVNEGLSSGEFQGQEFTADDAISFIKKGLDNNILVAEDIDSLKEQFPQIKDELNTVIAERATSQIEPEISEPEISEPEISEPEAPEYKDKDIEAIYKEAKERVRIEPVTLKELQDRFTERKGREATDREQEELNRVYEKAKKRSEFMAKREAKKVQPTKEEAEKVQPTKEEAEFEAYQPDLPPSKPEVRFRKTELTYPRGEKYVAGKEAPEGLVVEHKPALSTNNTPWKTQARALNALKNGRRFKAAGYTEETHEVVPVEGGFGIAKKVVEPTIERPAGGKPDLDTRRLTDSSGKDVDIKVGMHVKINDSTTGVVEGFEEGVVLFKTDPINEAERAGKARPLQKMNDSNIFDIIETPVAKETKGKAPTEKAAKPKAVKAEVKPEVKKESTLREPGAEHSKEKELKKLGAKIRGDKVVLYRGGNVSKKELKKLRYNDYLSLVKKGKDVTGNEGAAGYGKNVIRTEVSINDIKITNGEIQYIGKAESLEGGKKYPAEIYRAYNDYHGSNYTASEIDKETNVRAVASMALEGGREEFDARLAEFMPEVTEKTKSVELAKAQGERLKKEAGKRRLEDTGLLKETDEIVPGVTLNDFVEMATKEPAQAIGHIKTATVNKRQLIEGLRNKGMGALGRAPKSKRSAMRKNLGAVLEAVEKADIKYAKKVAEKKVQVALTPDTARKEIEKKIGKKSIDALEKSGKVKFITLDEARDITFEPMSDTQGFFDYHTNITYLIAENIDRGRAWNVLMHELGVHYGYNKIFGEKLAKEVFAAFVSENGKQTPLGKAVSEALKRVPPDTPANFRNEEAVAYFAENEANRDLSLWKKIKARVRLWMVKHLGVSPSVFTIDDYVAIAASAVRSEATIAERGRAKKTTEVTEEKPAKPVREGSLHERLGIPEGRLKRISEFSVPKMSLKDTVKKITNNPNFVKWFGGSNVIDEKGDPLVVYHGTRADFSEFLPETWGQNVSGAARNGFFFTSDPSEASGYVEGEAPGGRVMPLFLRIKKPLKLEYAQHGIDDIIKSDEDVASYLKKAQGIISKVRGIDGLILNDIGGKKGHNLYVTFESTQIKSIFNVGTFDPTKADIRYSKKEKVDLNKWADDLIAGAKKKGVVLDKPNPTPKELRESSVSVLAGLDNTKLAKPIRSFLAGMNPKGKGFGREFEKWFASPEWYQHPVMKKIVDSALAKSEKFHKLFNEFNAIDDPFAEHDTVAKTLEALARKGKMSKAAFILGRTSNDFKKLEQLLDDADVYNEKHTVESLKKDGYSEDVINAWSVVRESYDKQLDARLKPMKDLVARIKEEAAWKGVDPKDVVYPDFGEYIIDGKKRRLNLKEAILEMGNLKGVYSPRLRDPGDYVITGKKYGTVSQGGDDYVRFNRRTNSFANLLRDELESQGYTDIKVEKESRLPEETFQAVRIAEMGTVIGNAVNKGLDKYDTEQQIAFMDEVIRSASDTLKSRGSKSIMMRRRGGKAVKGYITNPLVRFVRYTGNNAAGLAKAEMGEKMIKALYGEMVNGEKVGGIDASKEGDVHSMARGYIEEQMRNAETGDKVVGIVKALTTLKFLGFNPRSVLVNLSSLTTSVPIALHTYAMDGKGSLAKIGVTLSGACKDYTKVMTGKRLSNTDEQTFIDEFQSNGYTDAQYTRDAVGNVQGAYGTAWSKLMGGSMYVFGKSEQWLRGGTALAAYRLTKKQGLSHAAASDKAILATGKAHGIYAKETLPMVAWGKGIGRLGQAFYTYMKFPHNYMQMLYDVGVRKKNMKAVIFGLAAPAVLGGVASVPMYATVIAIANAMLSSLGDDRDAEKMVYDTINEYVGSTGEEKIRGGVLGLLDIDISGSLSMGPGSIPTSLMELTGALGGAIEQVGQGIGYAASGEYGRAASKMLPQAIGNIFTAVREMKGATTSKGDVIWDENGQPYIPSTAETIKKGFGFRSSRRAQLGQTVWVSKREEGRFKETKSKIYKKIKFLTGKNEEIQLNKDVSDSISKYNKNALQTPNVTLITPASIASQVKGMTVPSSKKLARATESERAATFENSIWADALGITEIPDSTQSEVKRLSDLGMVKYSAPPSRTINAGHGIIVRLDDEQYSRYVTDNDTVIKEAVDKIIGLPKWSKLSDKKRAYAIKYITKKGRKFVRSRIKKAILIAKIKERRNR